MNYIDRNNNEFALMLDEFNLFNEQEMDELYANRADWLSLMSWSIFLARAKKSFTTSTVQQV